jgi:hypothetical protein
MSFILSQVPPAAQNRLLSAPHGRNQWCGPAAVSAVTGCSSDLAALLVAQDRYGVDCVRRLRGVRGTYTREVCKVLRVLGWRSVVSWFRSEDRETFAAWTYRMRADRRAWIVSTSEHWLAFQGDRVADNRAGLVRAEESALRRGRVVEVVCCWRTELVDFAALERSLLDQVREQRPAARARARTTWEVATVAADGREHSQHGFASKRAALDFLRRMNVPGGTETETRWVGAVALRVAETGERCVVAERGETDAWAAS